MVAPSHLAVSTDTLHMRGHERRRVDSGRASVQFVTGFWSNDQCAGDDSVSEVLYVCVWSCVEFGTRVCSTVASRNNESDMVSTM